VLLALLAFAFLHVGSDRLRPLAGWALAPLAVLAASSVALAPLSLWLERYLLFAAPYFLILVGASLVRVWRASRVVAGCVVVFYLAMMGPALAHYYRNPPHADWTGVAAFVRDEAHPGDSVVVSHDGASAPLAHYLGSERRIASAHLRENAPPSMTALRDALRPLCGGGRRVFLVYWRFGAEERHAAIREAVWADFVVERQQSFQQLDVYVLAGGRP
jgi:mannosyltransferase